MNRAPPDGPSEQVRKCYLSDYGGQEVRTATYLVDYDIGALCVLGFGTWTGCN